MFHKLAGNDHVKLTLSRLMDKGRVPNSLLFAGPEGVGKRLFALELARSYLCREPGQSLQACGVCATCRRVDTFVFPTSEKKEDFGRVFLGEHPDVGMVIPFNRNILVDAIRGLEREANFQPYEGRARFFIVDDADKMNDAAANALLKTLEEPPPTSHIFLISSRPDSLLPTIRSRCQTLRFAPVARDVIERFLIDERAYTHDEARLAARLSGGSIGRAMSTDVARFRRQRESMFTVLRDAVTQRSRINMLRTSEELHDPKNKEVFEEGLNTLQSLIHDLWTLCVASETERIVNTDLADELASISRSADPRVLTDWMAEVDVLRQNLAVNLNRRIAADALFMKMAGA